MTLVPVINTNVCAAHGVCESIAPEIFQVDDVAVVVGTGPDELMMTAAAECPTTAIQIVNGETGERVYP